MRFNASAFTVQIFFFYILSKASGVWMSSPRILIALFAKNQSDGLTASVKHLLD